MEKVNNYVWKASEGKVFKRIATGEVFSSLILLAKSDKITNYEEIDFVEPVITDEQVQ